MEQRRGRRPLRWVPSGGGNEVSGSQGSLLDARSLLTSLSLALASIGALAILLSVVPTAQGQTSNCEDKAESLQVPGAEKQDEYCLEDMTTKSLVEGVTTSRDDWS